MEVRLRPARVAADFFLRANLSHIRKHPLASAANGCFQSNPVTLADGRASLQAQRHFARRAFARHPRLRADEAERGDFRWRVADCGLEEPQADFPGDFRLARLRERPD